ncbi:hypothetical protein [Paenarthrobacter sp. JL.01a]|uniref:hypothetical protein n=1 Tax=Paenarthrobacter sp. JL.01a TaxID=2979324 RepID=UPI0021C8A18E|nr:hypothetical protein [Paenarthrobacter sp. JL.01a]UXM90579.1 hypothetical protein N5P29_14940 [Paenarthrobacter sp. JL.01a]
MAARKAKRDQQNINITLYVASLLLVAAGALFVGTSLPQFLRFAGIWFITALFYVSGLVIHAKVPRLRPAATAFVGTGLALIPVTGLAMYNFVLHSGPSAWLVTSLLGTALYAYTAVRLDNKVLAYLSLSFVVSTAWSGVSILGGALVWYFTAMIGVAVLLTLAALLRPRWIPPLYVRPLMTLHPYVVPLVALAVTVTPHLLAKGQYALVMLMCGLYFAVMGAIPRARFRIQHAYAARLALTLALAGLVWDLTADVSTVLFAAVLSLGVQALGVAFAGSRFAPRLWWNDSLSCLALQLVVSSILTVVLGFGAFDLPVHVPLAVTMLTAMCLGWKLRHGVEFSPAGVLVAALAFSPWLGAWPITILLISAAIFWFLLTIATTDYRRQLVFAGRIALTAAAPAAVAAVFESSPDRLTFSLAAFVAASALQQLVNGVLAASGTKVLAPQSSIVGFGTAAMVGLLALSAFDHSPGRVFVAVALLWVLGAGVVSGFLLFHGSRNARTGSASWVPTVEEVLAPATALLTGILAVATVSLTVGNAVLLVAVAYLCTTALRISRPFHRHVYWWLVRAGGTLLAASAYADATDHGWHVVLAGEIPSVPLVVAVAAALQLALPLSGASRRRSPTAPMIDAAVVLGVMAVATIVLTVDGRVVHRFLHEGWQPGVAALATALAAILCGVTLRRHLGAWLFAPATCALLLLVRAGDVRDVEILLGLFAAYSTFMAGTALDRALRGGYLIGARVLFTAFVALVVSDATESAVAVTIALALVLLVQHGVTLLLRSSRADVAFQGGTVVATLGAQLLLPLGYLAAGDYDGGGRWVVMFGLLLVPASAALAWRLVGTRVGRSVPGLQGLVAAYLSVVAVIAVVIAAGPALRFQNATWLYQPLLDRSQVPVVLLGLALVPVVTRALTARRPGRAAGVGTAWRWFWLVSSLAMVFTGGLLALTVSAGLSGLSVLVLAVVLFAASHLERLPSLYAAAAPSVLVGAVPAVGGLLEGLPAGVWTDFAAWLVGAVGSAVLLYAVKVLGGPAIRSELWRQRALAATAAVALASSAVVGMRHDETSLVAFGLVLALGALVVAEVPQGKWLAGEVAALASVAALQRAVLFVDGARPDWFWTVQWYVAAAAFMAGLRYIKGQRRDGLWRLCAGAGILSLTSVATIFGGTPAQQLYVLVAHVVLLAAGLVVADRIPVVWGAIGVVLSILWALRTYAFAMLALVAVGLIVLAVWRLNRKPPAGSEGQPESGVADNPASSQGYGGIR